jgi:hypothetical protein
MDREGGCLNPQSEFHHPQSRRPLEPDAVSTVEGRNSYRDRSILSGWSGFFFGRGLVELI